MTDTVATAAVVDDWLDEFVEDWLDEFVEDWLDEFVEDWLDEFVEDWFDEFVEDWLDDAAPPAPAVLDVSSLVQLTCATRTSPDIAIKNIGAFMILTSRSRHVGTERPRAEAHAADFTDYGS